jgi:hypothetical protein
VNPLTRRIVTLAVLIGLVAVVVVASIINS